MNIRNSGPRNRVETFFYEFYMVLFFVSKCDNQVIYGDGASEVVVVPPR